VSKQIILAVAGALVGVGVAFAAFTFLMGGAEPVEAAPPTEPVNVSGRLGPHITLADRVFNLLPEPGSPTYLKLQTVIEFETHDPRWAYVLGGCSKDHSAAPGLVTGALMVSAVPAGPPALPAAPEAGGGPQVDPCDAEEASLQAAFEHQIGTGVRLIEDAVTTIVTSHTASEVATPEGKAALRAEIAAAVEQLIDNPRVYRVLFLNFITQ
jgi:flagellar basal body-associated protein FliL